jgi:hypothetical protein
MTDPASRSHLDSGFRWNDNIDASDCRINNTLTCPQDKILEGGFSEYTLSPFEAYRTSL